VEEKDRAEDDGPSPEHSEWPHVLGITEDPLVRFRGVRMTKSKETACDKITVAPS